MEQFFCFNFRKHLPLLLSALLAVLCLQAAGQQKKQLETGEGCTSIMAGRLATEDGSVIVGHTCDGNYRTWVNVVQHKKNGKGAVRKIYWGNLHTEFPTDMRGKIFKGEISDTEETYSYINVAYPCLNEKQLAFGESTIYGRDELRNDEGMFLIEELQSIALERCTTARGRSSSWETSPRTTGTVTMASASRLLTKRKCGNSRYSVPVLRRKEPSGLQREFQTITSAFQPTFHASAKST